MMVTGSNGDVGCSCNMVLMQGAVEFVRLELQPSESERKAEVVP